MSHTNTTVVTREKLSNGKYQYKADGEVLKKQSKVFYDKAQIHEWPEGDLTISMGKTPGGGNPYMKKYWVGEVGVVEIGETGPDWEPHAGIRYYAQCGESFAFGPTIEKALVNLTSK